MKIKVLFFIDSFRIGGMHKQVLYLAKHLDREKFDCIVCAQSSAGGLCQEYESSGARIETLQWRRSLQIGVLKRFINFLRKEKPDIIFITTPQNLFYYRVARIFYSGNTVQIGSFRAMNFWQGHIRTLYKPIDLLLTIWMILTSKKISVNSHAMYERYTRFLPLIMKKKILVIYNGSDFNFPISVPALTLRKELKIPETDIIVAMIARFDPWKDFDTIIDAAALIKMQEKQIKFLLVGDGELKTYVEERIGQMELQDVVFTIGEKRNIYDYINLADISVLATKGEGFSNAILESMAFAKPVIASAVGGNSELLGTSEAEGFLAPLQSPTVFASLIVKLANDKSLRRYVGDQAKKKIEKLCDINEFVAAYSLLFEQSIYRKVKN